MANLFPLLKKIQQDRVQEAALVADALAQTQALDADGTFQPCVFLDNDLTASMVSLDPNGNPVFTPMAILTDPTMTWSVAPTPPPEPVAIPG